MAPLLNADPIPGFVTDSASQIKGATCVTYF